MEKGELIDLSKHFIQEAFQANCYYDIIKQYSENFIQFHEEMGFSSAFYTLTYNALVVATFMELAKIYDNHKQSISIARMMDICKKHIFLFPEQLEIKTINEGKESIEKYPFSHTVSSDEEEFFKKEVECQNTFNKLFDVTGTSVDVELTLEKYFELYEWKYERIKPKIKNLLKQRNKIYAHNDQTSLDNIKEVISNFPLNRIDIESLISFALEFCKFIIALLTGVNKADKPVNINDWQGTLILARLGYKYKDVETAKDVEEFMNKCFPETE